MITVYKSQHFQFEANKYLLGGNTCGKGTDACTSLSDSWKIAANTQSATPVVTQPSRLQSNRDDLLDVIRLSPEYSEQFQGVQGTIENERLYIWHVEGRWLEVNEIHMSDSDSSYSDPPLDQPHHSKDPSSLRNRSVDLQQNFEQIQQFRDESRNSSMQSILSSDLEEQPPLDDQITDLQLKISQVTEYFLKESCYIGDLLIYLKNEINLFQERREKYYGDVRKPSQFSQLRNIVFDLKNWEGSSYSTFERFSKEFKCSWEFFHRSKSLETQYQTVLKQSSSQNFDVMNIIQQRDDFWAKHGSLCLEMTHLKLCLENVKQPTFSQLLRFSADFQDMLDHIKSLQREVSSLHQTFIILKEKLEKLREQYLNYYLNDFKLSHDFLDQYLRSYSTDRETLHQSEPLPVNSREILTSSTMSEDDEAAAQLFRRRPPGNLRKKRKRGQYSQRERISSESSDIEPEWQTTSESPSSSLEEECPAMDLLSQQDDPLPSCSGSLQCPASEEEYCNIEKSPL